MNGKNDFVFYMRLQQYYDALGKLAEPSIKEEKQDGVFHYTTTKVLNAILSTGCFRASNLFYLNDKVEYKMGIQILKQLFKEDKTISGYIKEIESYDGKSWGGVYSISYSNKPDVLQQWITYAKESGVCIELDSNIIWGDAEENGLYMKIKVGKDSFVRFKSKCFLKLAYEKDAISPDSQIPQLNKDLIREVFAEAIVRSKHETGKNINLDEKQVYDIWSNNKEEAKQFLQLLASYYKEERFSGEGEIRAAFLPVYKSKNSYSNICYFEQENGVLRPYINVFFSRNNNEDGEFSIECPIKSILIGPSGDQLSVYNSVVHRLKYGEVKVWKYSKIQLANQLSNFVLGCYEKNEDLKIEDYREIAEYIADKWCAESNFSYEINIATKKKVDIVLKDECYCNTKDINKNEVALRYMEDNYLSPTGIWVKKSSLPYIF